MPKVHALLTYALTTRIPAINQVIFVYYKLGLIFHRICMQCFVVHCIILATLYFLVESPD